MAQPVYVIGHRNPDTDASTATVAYARFLNEAGRYDAPVIAAVPGPLTPQARWVFETAEVEPPVVIPTFAPRVRDVCQRDPARLLDSQSLGEANEALIRSGHSMLPITDSDDRLVGVFSNREDVSRFLMSLDVVPLAPGFLSWGDLRTINGIQVCGQAAPNEACGQFFISLAGDDSWCRDAEEDSILICGGVQVCESVASENRPRRIIVVSNDAPSDSEVRHANQNGIFVLHYAGALSALLQSLTHQVRLSALNMGRGPCVGEDDLLADVRSLIKQSRRAVPVVSEDDRLTGVVARSDLQSSPRRRAILVDHFEAAQAVPGIDHMEIIEVIDHHRIGNIETTSPIRVDCRPIGSSASIVALNYFEAARTPDRSTAILLLGGICADTLALNGPTATDVDRRIARHLAEIAGIDLPGFGRRVLQAGDDLVTATPADIWNRDQKLFSIRNHQFAVAQLETVALDALPPPRLEAFRAELESDFRRNNYLSSVLVLTDVLKRNSWITGLESDAARGTMQAAFGSVAPRPGWIEAPNVVSRKKQIVPKLMNTFAELTP